MPQPSVVAYGCRAGRALRFIGSQPMSIHATKTTAHPVSRNEIFVSGAYVEQFNPEAAANPFRADYEAKRKWVVESVAGRGKHVLDVGGAMGRMAIPLAHRHDVTLCDLSERMLKLARHSSDVHLRLAVGDVTALPFADGCFDWALCIDVLPHVAEPRTAFGEIRRVLRPGGKVIVDSTNSQPLWTLAYPGYLGRRPSRWWKIWRSGGVLPEWTARVRHMRFDEFRNGLVAAGFKITSRRAFGPGFCPKWHALVAEAV